MQICREEMPEATTLTETHEVQCWLQHENAPKVEVPLRKGGTL